MVTSIKFDVASLTVHRHGVVHRYTVVEPKKITPQRTRIESVDITMHDRLLC